MPYNYIKNSVHFKYRGEGMHKKPIYYENRKGEKPVKSTGKR